MNAKLVDLSLSISCLEPLGKMIGVKREFWIKKESKKNISFSLTLENTIVQKMIFQPIKDVLTHFGNSVSIDLSIGELIIYSNRINSGINAKQFDQIIKDNTPNDDITFSIEIDKEKYIRKWYRKKFRPSDKLFLVFFMVNLENLLKDSKLMVIQEKIWDCVPKPSWSETEKKEAFNRILKTAVVIIPDIDLYCKCDDYLLVIGGKYLVSHSPETTKQDRLPILENYMARYDLCQEKLKWQINKRILLSPWHFYISEYSPESSGIAQSIRYHFFNLFILYTADRTVFINKIGEADKYRAMYCGSNQQTEIILSDPWRDRQLSISDENADYLKQIIDFIYENEKTASDKIMISQLVIIDRIIGLNDYNKPENIINHSKSILEKMKWQWKMLIEGKIRQNWKQIHEIENSIHETVIEFSDQISVLASKLTDTV